MKKKLFKFLITAITVLCLLSFFSVCCMAAGEDSELRQIYSEIPEETKELLEELGIYGADFENILNVGIDDVLSLLKKLLTGGIESPLRSFTRLTAVIILVAVCGCFIPEDDKMNIVSEMAGILICCVTIISPLSTAVSSAAASIAVSEKFILLLIPVLAGVITAAGNPVLALSFQSVAFTAAQFIAGASKNYIVPVVGALLALDITGAIMPSFKLSGLTDFIKKSITAVLSFAATLFVSFLSIKGALSNAADTVAAKGIKLVISSAVPVVGGAVSEAYSGIIGSLVLVKSTMGVLGICAIALINLPSCIQLLFWTFALKAGAAVGELFNEDSTAKLLRAIASAVTLLNIVVLFNAVLFIISTALILTLKAG